MSSRSRRSIQTCLHLLVCLRIQSLPLLSSLYLWLKISYSNFVDQFRNVKLNKKYIVNMAAEGARPPDATLTKFYKCHPTTQVGAVVCILCDSVYHTREIVAKYNAGYPVKFLSNTLIICQDHANVALTSNLP